MILLLFSSYASTWTLSQYPWQREILLLLKGPTGARHCLAAHGSHFLPGLTLPGLQDTPPPQPPIPGLNARLTGCLGDRLPLFFANLCGYVLNICAP